MVKKIIKDIFRKLGFDIIPFNHVSHPTYRRFKLLSHHQIDLIFDIGANIGQYAQEVRKSGFAGKIISFEPVRSAYTELYKKSAKDSLWEAINIGIGNFDGQARINIAKESHSSSLLNILPASLSNCPSASIIGTEDITVNKIDSIIKNYWQLSNKLYIKIDTQGYEYNVIEGASFSLNKIFGLEVELSFITLYEGEILFNEMLQLLMDKGFKLMSINPGLCNYSTGQLLQADCIFYR